MRSKINVHWSRRLPKRCKMDKMLIYNSPKLTSVKSDNISIVVKLFAWKWLEWCERDQDGVSPDHESRFSIRAIDLLNSHSIVNKSVGVLVYSRTPYDNI